MLTLCWQHRASLAICLVLMVAEAAAALTIPWLGGKLAGGAVGAEEVGIGALALLVASFLIAVAVLRMTSQIVLASTSERIVASLRSSLFDHLQSLPLAFFQARRHGDTLAVLTRDIEHLANFATGTLVGLVPKLFLLAGAFVLMIQIDLLLALPVIVAIPVCFLVIKLVGRRVRSLSGEVRAAYSETISLADVTFSMLPAIKSFTHEQRQSTQFMGHVGELERLGIRVARIRAVVGPALQLLSALAVVAVVWAAGTGVFGRQMEPAALVTFLLYAALLTRPVSALADCWGQFQLARGALLKLDEVLATTPEPYADGVDPKPVAGAIRYEEVGFAHRPGIPVLSNVSFDVRAGETIALIGENGAGKSTIVDLLLRFHTPDAGRIMLDGRDIRDIRLKGLRRAIAVVPQEPMLFDGTIAENICFGDPAADQAKMIWAARKAQASAFIEALPQGYRTTIGERGVRLSGGERQRIALARALIKDPAILVLDEPTAMFDPEGERRFVADAREALHGRTVISITHRPASLALADRVVELEDGSVKAISSGLAMPLHQAVGA